MVRPGHRLDDRVVHRLADPRPDVAEAADGGIDDVRCDTTDVGLADTQPVDHAGAEVLHEDVGALGEIEHDLASTRVLHVDGHRALVAVDVEEHRRHAGTLVAERAHVVADVRNLDLDHVGALVCQDHRRPRAGQHRRHVDDANAGERSTHALSPCHAAEIGLPGSVCRVCLVEQ